MLMRNKKEAFEIELIKKANNIAEKSFLELLNEVKIGKTEKELAALFDYIMARNGSDGVSFDTILLTGTHTSMPHGVPSDKKSKTVILCSLILVQRTKDIIQIWQEQLRLVT